MSELCVRAAEAVAGTIEGAVRSRGSCSLVLSGGNTPRALYRRLATGFKDEIPWRETHLFWGDERYVPLDDSRSNYRMARESLLDHVPSPAVNIHPMPTHLANPEDAAREYERILMRYRVAGTPCFDLVLLGIGHDGHTASLFPGSTALHERTRWVLPVIATAEPPVRLTMTLPALTASTSIHFLVAGSDKAHAVAGVLAGSADPNVYPAAAVQSSHQNVVWWLDRDAASQLR